MSANGAVYSAGITLPACCDAAYYIEATDANGETRSWGSADAPQPVAVGNAVSAPSLEVERAPLAVPGQDLTVTTRVDSDEDLQSVTLYYRDLNQRELFTPVPMHQANGVWSATIPGMDIVPAWDLMYYVEAIDRLGNGAIGPDLDVETPYIVVPVQR